MSDRELKMCENVCTVARENIRMFGCSELDFARWYGHKTSYTPLVGPDGRHLRVWRVRAPRFQFFDRVRWTPATSATGTDSITIYLQGADQWNHRDQGPATAWQNRPITNQTLE